MLEKNDFIAKKDKRTIIARTFLVIVLYIAVLFI
jgi:hypothetical protein